MIVAAHQPNYPPDLGFFNKMEMSDVFVIRDDAQFVRQNFHHRNRIRIYSGWKWLTVPIKKEEIPNEEPCGKPQGINSHITNTAVATLWQATGNSQVKEIKIINEPQKNKPHWSKIHFREIHANYAKTKYFNTKEKLGKIMKEYEKLVDLNMNLIKFLMKEFKLKVKIIKGVDMMHININQRRIKGGII